jgi:subtilisin family serine protease
MSLVLRSLFVSVISISLIWLPVFSFSAAARNNNQSQQGVSSFKAQQLPDHESGALLVKFNSEAPAQSQSLIIDSVSKSHHRLRGQSGIIKLTLKEELGFDTALNTLQQYTGVIEWVEPNYLVNRAGGGRTDSSSRSRTTGQAEEKRTSPNPSAIIALIDTGVDIRHRDLRDALWLNAVEKSGLSGSDDDSNGFADDARGWNFIDDSNDINDDNGHGTQVAGIITQSRANLSILPLKALDRTGRGTIAEVVEAIDYAVARRAAVINCSFGAPAYSRAMFDAIQRAETAGIVVVAAAGNNGRDLSKSSFYPASYRLPNLISVAATDEHDLLTSFSNYSADIAAPGTDIRTTHPEQS